MANRSLTLTLSLLALAGLARGLQGGADPAAQQAPARPPAAQPSSGPAPSAPKVRVFPSGRQLLEEFLLTAKADVTPGARKGGAADSTASLAAARGGEPLPPVGVLVATLPDPTDSHLDWAFDSDFEAILRAYERAGYVLDRFWLPWTEKSDTMVAWGDGASSRRVREVYPGVVLFRRDSTESLVPDSSAAAAAAPGPAAPPAPALQLLYLVGEIPTRGVHKDALARALEDRDLVLRLSGSRDDLRIVGPAFSGSARSMAIVLDRWRAAHPGEHAQVITGSATGGDVRPLLEAGGQVDFGATVHTDDVLMRALVQRVLCPLRIPDDQVAVLRESGTSYGREVATGTTIPCGDGRRLAPSSFLSIPFPMNIGSLRAELEASAPRQPEADAPHSRARLTLRDPDRPGDRPSLSSQLTTPTNELMMDEIERAVTSHRIRAVGILASDVRDKLFLATELRRRLHDVQLFTFEGNALFLVPENNEALRGMLVVSTYPLTLQSQWWTPSFLRGVRLSFPNEGAAGIHNATLMQLGAGAYAVSYAFPFLDRPAARQRPPVWISTVGREAMMPVTVDTSRADSSLRTMAQQPRLARETPALHFFTAAAIVLLAAALLFALRGYLWPWRPAPGVDPAVPWEYLADHESRLDEVRWSTQNFHRSAYLGMRGLALLSAFLPVSAFIATSLWRRTLLAPPGGVGRLLMVAFVAAVALVGLLATGRVIAGARARLAEAKRVGLPFARGGWGDDLSGKRFWWIEIVLRGGVFLGGAVYFALSAWFTVQLFRLSATRPISYPLFLERAGELGSGVSPLVPLLLGAAGFAAWSSWHSRRIGYLQDTTPYEAAWHQSGAADAAPAATALPADTARWVREVRTRLFMVIPDWPGALVLMVVMILAVILWFQVDPTLERLIALTSFDRILKFSIIGSLVGTCWAVYRLLSVWRALDRVLQGLSETPLVSAFRRLPDRVGQLTRLTLWRTPSRDVLDMVSAAQWRQLRQLHAQAVGGFATLDSGSGSGEAPAPALADEVAALMAPERPPPSRFPRRLARGDDDSFLRLNRILSRLWASEPDAEVVAEIRDELKKSPEVSSGVFFRRSFASPVRLWMRVAEEFAAVQVVDYIEWVLQQLRVLTLFLFASLLLTTALLSSYPYQPQSLVKLVFLFVLLATVGTLLFVMAALNRDDVLSLVAKSDPGRVNWDRTFVMNAITVGVVPLLTLIGSEVPEINLFGWLQPILHLLGGG
jgi:hypothetical protein